jgi:hypothetical protein
VSRKYKYNTIVPLKEACILSGYSPYSIRLWTRLKKIETFKWKGQTFYRMFDIHRIDWLHRRKFAKPKIYEKKKDLPDAFKQKGMLWTERTVFKEDDKLL